MKKLLRRILGVTAMEMFLAATTDEVIFAQNFDLPSRLQSDIVSFETGKQHPGLEEQFKTYHFQDAGYSDIYDSHGVRVYTSNEVKRLLEKEIPVSYIEDIKKIKNQEYKPVFDALDIVKFYQNSVTLSEIHDVVGNIKTESRKDLLKEIYHTRYINWSKENNNLYKLFRSPENFRTLYSLSLVKRSGVFFTDTEKPNLLITYPVLDKEKSFFTPTARELIKKLSNTYDIWFVTLKSEKDLYRALKHCPEVDLLIISGHGNKEKIKLNQTVDEYNEIGYIDTKDKELKKYFKLLHPNATIFLNACSTGSGENIVENLANKIAGYAPGRKVIAATAPFSIGEVNILQAYPLFLEIEEKTYITQNSR